MIGAAVGEAPSRPDCRLVPAALVVWLGVAAGLLWSWWCAVLAGACGVLAACWLLHRRWQPAAAVALLLCGLVTAGALAGAVRGVQRHPLRAAAADATSVTMRVELANRPKPLHSPGFGGRPSGVRTVLVQARAVAAERYGRPFPAGADVLLFAPAGEWSRLLIGQQVTARGKLAPARGGDTTVAVLRVRGPPRDAGAPGFGQRQAQYLRSGLHEAAAGPDPAVAGLLPGLVEGDTSAVPPQLTDDMRTAGLSHVTAVSGANLAIVCGAVLLLLRGFRIGPRCSALVAGVALAGFVLLAGPDPSVLRAAVMAVVALVALALGRPRAAVPALACSVVVLVCADPAMAVSLGFTLSVLATAGLVLLVPGWSAGLRRRGVPLALAQAFAVPAAAHLVTAPVIAGMSGKLSLVAIAANLLVAPVIAPATVLGLLAAVAAPVSMPAAHLFVWLATPEVDWTAAVGRVSADLPGATLPWPAGWTGALLLTGIAVVVVVALRRRASRVVLLVAALAALAVTVPPRALDPGWPAPGWSMVSCDVGQGDAEVLATADPGRAIVVDTGPDEDAVDDCLTRLDVQRVPLVVLSHLHADHVGGLAAVLAGRSVGAVAIGPSHTPEWALREVSAEARAAGVPLLRLARGQRLGWPGLALDVLAPLPAEAVTYEGDDVDGTDINNTSVVLRATTAAGRVLLTGDVELQAQADLLSSGADLRAAVLKIPHHGSRYSAPAFLDAAGARIAIASVGAGNSYGHPNQLTLGRLTDDRALVLRTDRDGDVAVLAPEHAGEPPRVLRRGHPRPAPD